MAILYGTTSDGSTLPVLVDQFGNLLAKGIEGPPGPIGPPGVGELPPGATDGALLGWENGELVWVTEPLPPVYVPGFRPVIYTGNGGTQSITGLGFSPSLVWIKSRSDAYSHQLADAIRGTGVTLSSNTTDAQGSTPFNSFDSDGFTVGDGTGVNAPGSNFVAWCWEASDTTVTNNDGSIESQVRSNGNFSVVTYSGNSTQNATIGHGLSTKPSFQIVKSLNNPQDWVVYTDEISGNLSYGYLNKTDILQGAAQDLWTDSVVSLWNDAAGNTTGTNYVSYLWAETPGVSYFGSYQSTGMRTFIHVGFLPSMVIIKSTSTGHWFMFDNARGTQYALRADESAKEDEIAIVEFKDDGFQLLFAFPGVNTENETYIYAAFANPEDALLAQRQLRRQARQEERQQNETRLR